MNEEAKYLLTLISLYYLNIHMEDLPMALEKISDKQKEILEFIKSEILNVHPRRYHALMADSPCLKSHS